MNLRQITLLVSLLCLGCGSDPSQPTILTAEQAAHAELPLLSKSPHQGLQAELSLVIQQCATPGLLSRQSGADQNAPRARLASRTKVAKQQATIAGALNQAFPPISRPLVRGQIDEVYAGGPLSLSPIQLERGRDLLRKHAEAIDRFRRALAGDQSFGLPLERGILVNLEFLEPLEVGCHLEAIAAADALAENLPARAIPHLQVMLHAAQKLSLEMNITTRLAAANLRADALFVLRAVAAHTRVTRDIHIELLRLLETHAADWPHDAQAWIGDRAAGLLIYELVRDGQYLSLLPADEVKRLEEQKIVNVTGRAVMRNIDADQLFYLRATRQMIDACNRPYFERTALLKQLRRDLTETEQTADYPLVAATLLLDDFETAHRRQAEDLARFRACQLALTAALDQPTDLLEQNPLTGRPYTLTHTPLAITITDIAREGITDDPPIELPILPAQ